MKSNKETFKTKYFTFDYYYDNMTEDCRNKMSKEIKKYLKEHEEELNKQFLSIVERGYING